MLAVQGLNLEEVDEHLVWPQRAVESFLDCDVWHRCQICSCDCIHTVTAHDLGRAMVLSIPLLNHRPKVQMQGPRSSYLEHDVDAKSYKRTLGRTATDSLAVVWRHTSVLNLGFWKYWSRDRTNLVGCALICCEWAMDDSALTDKSRHANNSQQHALSDLIMNRAYMFRDCMLKELLFLSNNSSMVIIKNLLKHPVDTSRFLYYVIKHCCCIAWFFVQQNKYLIYFEIFCWLQAEVRWTPLRHWRLKVNFKQQPSHAAKKFFYWKAV